MNKKILSFLLILLLFVAGCSEKNEVDKENEKKAYYNLYSKVYDDGQKINKVEIEMPFVVKSDELELDTFDVNTNNTLPKEYEGKPEFDNGSREIKDIYIKGHMNEGKTVVLELRSDFGLPYTKTLVWDDEAFSNVPLEVNYDIIQKKKLSNIKVEDFEMKDIIDHEVDKFISDESSNGIKYRAYKPKDDTKKHPLIIWFHGAGEGGENNSTHITANRGAVAFITEEAQAIFEEPHVLAPQSPDFWMPEFEVGERILKGTDRTKELVVLIEEYIENNNVDPKRVYVGGASMGGYQTWEILAEKPSLFAAGFPIASAYEVPEEKLKILKDMPIWLTHALEDATAPYSNSKNAFDYLEKDNDQIILTTYKNVKLGNEEFDAHASWVYALNNKPEFEGLNLFEWLYSKEK